ncbi:hypothetical protein [Chelatococcus sp.]|uniref:hypothetical protein n=1 Tax=Chelatococcus sp. TaxID=1953771 RepID=UPI001EC39E9A|nr:hypothetical protein [Chelatococcus sp.]MBX3547453.1 hypothetical protein [Chelatococcus sp.]CAH1678326.1 hypothetical protein CHELA41_24520 [Hyphomicrobiales bacterium]
MEARERLANVLASTDGIVLRHEHFTLVAAHFRRKYLVRADAILKALNLSVAAALALMDGEGVVVPNYPDSPVIGPCLCGSWPGGRCLKCQTTTNPPYKENPDDPR